ncbi:MAG: AmmeMemoRadiSam system protein B [Planctomycetes bacterium]|nr:AmmeMemoRadiSam system protein B [Planctomycetota bacterium]
MPDPVRDNALAKPRLRPIEAIPVEDGRIALRDPAGYSEQVLAVTRPMAFLLQFFDGEHSFDRIAAKGKEALGQAIPLSDLRAAAVALDEAGFLDSPSFRKRKGALEREFRTRKTRAPFHAGRSYPASASAFRDFHRDLLGNGAPAGDAGAIRAAIAPHIEISLGKDAYAAVYRRLRGAERPGRVVILGTSHMGLEHAFALTLKPYETPLGTLPADGAVVDRLVAACGEGVLQDEIRHRTEHTIEFQAVLLHGLWSDAPPRIVPVLCGFSHAELHGERERKIARFAEALAEAVSDGVPTLFLASVDFAHIGPRYGDPRGPTSKDLDDLRRHEAGMSALLARRDAEGFHRAIAQTQDGTRVCGFPALYTMLRTLREGTGEPVAYGQAKMDDQGSVVSFGGMVYR